LASHALAISWVQLVPSNPTDFTVTASSYYNTASHPNNILRGTGTWNAGDGTAHGPQWIMFDFKTPTQIDQITLVVDASSSLNATILLTGGITSGRVFTYHTFEQVIYRDQQITFNFPAGTVTRYLTVNTTKELTSWVAWQKITILQSSAPVPCVNNPFPFLRCTADVLVPTIPSSPITITASASYSTASPQRLLYGTGEWNSGRWTSQGPQWVTYDFSKVERIDRIELTVDASPNCDATILLTGGEKKGSDVVFNTFNQLITRNDVISFDFTPGTKVRYLTVNTTTEGDSVHGASWVAWFKIVIYQNHYVGLNV